MDENRLEDYIKYKLNKHLTPTDGEKMWEAIEAKRNKKKRRGIFLWFFIGLFIIGNSFLFFLGSSQHSLSTLTHSTILHSTSEDICIEEELCIENNNAIANNVSTANEGYTIGYPHHKSFYDRMLNTTPDLKHTTNNNAVALFNNKLKDATLTHELFVELDEIYGIQLSHESDNIVAALPHKSPYLPTSFPALDLSASVYNLQEQTDNSSPIIPVTSSTKQWEAIAIVGGGYGLNRKTLTDKTNNNSAYLLNRKKTENTLDHFKFNIGSVLQHQSGIYGQIDAEYLQFTEKYDVKLQNVHTYKAPDQLIKIIIGANGIPVEVRDSAFITDIITSHRQKYNRYKFIDLNFQIGYQFMTKSNWSIFIEGGGGFNIYSSQSGEILDEEQQIYNLATDTNNWWKTNKGASVSGKIGLSYQLSEDFSIWVAPSVKHYLHSMTTTNYTLQQQFTALSLGTGIKYNLTK